MTLTATDALGNTSNCTATFTANDVTPPSITAPTAVEAGNSPGVCGASGIDLGIPSTSDNCGVASVTNNAPASFPTGTTVVTWTATDVHGLTATATQNVTITDTTAPLVTLTGPNGGEVWVTGSTHAIAWTASDNCGLTTFDLELSLDSGASWSPIVSAQAWAAGFAWTVPGSLSSHVRVRVRARDAAGNATSDASDADFTIRPTNFAPVLTPIGNKVTDELVLLSFSTSASDPDAGQTLVWSLDAGAPAGTAIGAATGLFTWTPTEAQGPGVYSVTVRVTDNGSPALAAFETISITVNEVDLAAVTLTATPVTSGNDTDGTTKIHVSWTPQAPGTAVAVYRRGFGGYPRYDNLGGAEPAPPGPFPPAAGWTLVAASSGSSLDDELTWPARDFFYYVAYVKGPGTNVSPASNRTGGTLGYVLGDVSSTALPAGNEGHGDNVVNLSDISLLGAHYGLSGASTAAFDYLDIGPTTTGYVDGRPLTDQRIDFEDLILFSIDYNFPGSLVTSSALTDRVWAEGPASVTAGQPFTVHVHMSASGAVQGLSVPLFWDASIAQPTGATAGSWLTGQSAVMMSPKPGTVDAAVLGVHATGLSGDGILADVTFLALVSGNPHVGIANMIARDALNRPLGVTPLAVGTPGLRATTALSAATPNPFRTTAQFVLNLPVAGPMELAIYSVDGRRVRTVAGGDRAAGEYRMTWDGRGDTGAGLEAGLYFAKLVTRAGQWVKPVALLR